MIISMIISSRIRRRSFSMEPEKRKREDDDEMDGNRAKGIIEGGESKVKEEEEKEFFAILKRIHVAV